MINEFNELRKIWYLEEIAKEECPMCGNDITYYVSKYIESVCVRFCHHCHELEKDTYIDKKHPNICPYCDKIVSFEDDDKDNYVICCDESCDQKAHLSCVEDLICDECNIWACDYHIGDYYECNHCGRIHDSNCIVSLGSDFVDEFGILCDKCFYRDEDLLDEIKRPFKTPNKEHILNNIDKNRNFYIIEARENFDLTILVTHLIKGDSPWETLKTILTEKCIRASVTGYYGKLNNTKAVCFADLSIRGLQRHSAKYSPYGLAFLKELIFDKGGGPALYIREDIIKQIPFFPDILKPFVNKINLYTYDFHHEREWRVPGDFHFEYHEISVLFAPLKYHPEIRKLFPDIHVLLDLDFLTLI
ncbi:hypothetical protein [Desulfofundulus thermocisternus]|uniref:hypothetical protein n=1 Tax=Desulfofundulus thermocisternus TaxID=42471 RepID=UPI00217F1A16|nr:hypothetical protein [Desulfofundulus thermocisternus]MCS5696943.1 hypothetical protein [Desulfofundulus thermocisternus]